MVPSMMVMSFFYRVKKEECLSIGILCFMFITSQIHFNEYVAMYIFINSILLKHQNIKLGYLLAFLSLCTPYFGYLYTGGLSQGTSLIIPVGSISYHLV